AQLAHAQPHVDPIREGDAALVLAMRLGAYADHLALVDVEAALVDQPCIDGGVEERVVLDVVDVPVHVVVLPAGLDRGAVRVFAGGRHEDAECSASQRSGESAKLPVMATTRPARTKLQRDLAGATDRRRPTPLDAFRLARRKFLS